MERFIKLMLIWLALMFFACSKNSDEPTSFRLLVSASPTYGGTVSITGGTYKEGETISITASAHSGFMFREWTGDMLGTKNPASVTMNSNKTIVATFVRNDIDGDGASDELDQCSDTPDGVQVDKNGCTAYIYRDVNGVTIKAYDYAEVGDTGVINGVTYTIVDEARLREMIANDEDVSNVCTSRVTDMHELFLNKTNFNANIATWDVSNVNSLRGMFWGAKAFNQYIGAWDVSNVINMGQMFFHAEAFNQNIGVWDVSKVTDVSGMFNNALSFNQDLSSWVMHNVFSCIYINVNTPNWTLPKPSFPNCFFG